MSHKLFSIFVLLAIVFVLPGVALADKPDNKPQHGNSGSESNPDDNGKGPERNDNDPGRIDSDDESSKPNGKNDNGSGNESDGDCDDNEGNCNTHNPSTEEPSNPTSTPETEVTPMPDNTPIPTPESINTPIVVNTPIPQDNTPEVLTTTLVYTDSLMIFPETGECVECNVCEKLDTIISQNDTILANQQIMINLLSKLVNWLIGNK
jgi:hypothetical protein